MVLVNRNVDKRRVLGSGLASLAARSIQVPEEEEGYDLDLAVHAHGTS